MSLTFEKRSLTIGELKALYNTPKGIRLPIFQRPPDSRWDRPEKRDGLLANVLSGHSINSIHVRIYYNADGSIATIELVDGQQRARVINAVTTAVNPYTPTKLPEAWEHLNGLPFESWPDVDKAQFLNYALDLTNHKIDDDDTLGKLFLDLNRPAPLSGAQAYRGQCRTQIEKISSCATTILNGMTEAKGGFEKWRINDVEEMILTAIHIARGESKLNSIEIANAKTEESNAKLTDKTKVQPLAPLPTTFDTITKNMWPVISKMELTEEVLTAVESACKNLAYIIATFTLADDKAIYNSIGKKTVLIPVLGNFIIHNPTRKMEDPKQKASRLTEIANNMISFFACTKRAGASKTRLVWFDNAEVSTGSMDSNHTRFTMARALLTKEGLGSGFETGKRPAKKQTVSTAPLTDKAQGESPAEKGKQKSDDAVNTANKNAGVPQPPASENSFS